MSNLRNFLKNEDGATAIEYGLIAALIAVAIITAVTLVAGLAACTSAFGWPPAAVALATWLLYVLVYTPMKRWSPLNTAVGAVAGALPVAIGWLAVRDRVASRKIATAT